jgi:hypothetical protein
MIGSYCGAAAMDLTLLQKIAVIVEVPPHIRTTATRAATEE